MTARFYKIALAALIAGAAFAGGFAAMNGTGIAQTKFKFKMKANCMPGMKLVGSPTNSNYGCLKGILTICKEGYKSGTPTLVQKSAKVWKVEYSCGIPPK